MAQKKKETEKQKQMIRKIRFNKIISHFMTHELKNGEKVSLYTFIKLFSANVNETNNFNAIFQKCQKSTPFRTPNSEHLHIIQSMGIEKKTTTQFIIFIT